MRKKVEKKKDKKHYESKVACDRPFKQNISADMKKKMNKERQSLTMRLG